MIAYKFRSASTIQFAFDILLNKRLRCSDWTSLNDPMEGLFEYSTRRRPGARKFLDQVIKSKLKYKVCSLSQRYDSTLLWAHYGDSYSGLAVEVELPSATDARAKYDRSNVIVAHVDYRPEFAFSQVSDREHPGDVACRILCSKQSDWAYEHEVRILSTAEWFPLSVPARRVIAGPRMNDALFDALKLICQAKNVELCQLRISRDRLTIAEVKRGRRS